MPSKRAARVCAQGFCVTISMREGFGAKSKVNNIKINYLVDNIDNHSINQRFMALFISWRGKDVLIA
jgi:hypothetical protein